MPRKNGEVGVRLQDAMPERWDVGLRDGIQEAARENVDCDDPEEGKIYCMIRNLSVEKDGYLCVIGESGDDDLYPVSFFVQLQLLLNAEQDISVRLSAVQ